VRVQNDFYIIIKREIVFLPKKMNDKKKKKTLHETASSYVGMWRVVLMASFKKFQFSFVSIICFIVK
jgi:hypothetical protein